MADTSLQSFLTSRAGRLAATYFAIIVAMTLFFSVLLFSVMSLRLDHSTRSIPESVPIEQQFFRRQTDAMIHERIEATRSDLLMSIILFNIAIYIGAGFFSYFIAHKTLEPIEDALERQAQFVSDASHELRTPLTAIQTTNEVALRNNTLKLKDAREVMKQTIEDVNKLHRLASLLLGLAQDEKVKKQEIIIQDVVTEAIQPIVPLALKKDIAIEESTDQNTAFGHRESVSQILRILLENAVKYSPSKTTIHITNRSTGPNEIISVKDHGMGINEGDRGKVFDRFYRSDNSRSSQKTEGFGLGLAIARQLAERQGYTLRLDSTSDQEGSTFTLSIPKK